MNAEAQRIALAEFEGWTRGKRREGSFSDPSKTIEYDSWINPNGYPERRLPDFLEDLNAVARLEARLTHDQRMRYQSRLQVSCGDDFYEHKTHWSPNPIHATAPQRCAALLRTLGLWKD